ncbi:MAG TPA: transporter, partial [Limnobacter sp.]|nr:transporter [Limnobacter sp.]
KVVKVLKLISEADLSRLSATPNNGSAPVENGPR